jgi:hypothetical protein
VVKVLPGRLKGENEETKKLGQSLSRRDSNPASLEYKTRTLQLQQPARLIDCRFMSICFLITSDVSVLLYTTIFMNMYSFGTLFYFHFQLHF